MIWQHGKYHITPNNGSIVMIPYNSDGYIQTMGNCEDPTVAMAHYGECVLGCYWRD